MRTVQSYTSKQRVVVFNSIAVIVILDGHFYSLFSKDRAVYFNGRQPVQCATALLVKASALCTGFPLIISVAIDEEAMAEPHP